MKEYIIKYYLLFKNIPFLILDTKPNILTFNETIDQIVQNKSSFTRFGDGEIRMMLNSGEIGFQQEDKVLTEKLNEVINSNVEKLIIGLPNIFKILFKNTLHSQIFWYGFNQVYARIFLKKINLKKVYGDSLITRFYLMYKKKNNSLIDAKIRKLKTIWNNEDILFVEGKLTRLGVSNDLFDNAKNIQRLICPSENAFEQYNLILEEIKLVGKDKLILIALGPTATVLTYDLAKIGYWAIDIGHIDVEYMWYQQKAEEKSAIKGRYINEVGGCSEETSFDLLELYQKQIIKEL